MLVRRWLLDAVRPLEQCDRNRCTVRETWYVLPYLLNKYWLSRSFLFSWPK